MMFIYNEIKVALMLKRIGLWLVIMTVSVQLTMVVGCQQQVEEPSVPSPQPQLQSEPAPPTPRPTSPPTPPASLNPPGFLHIGDLAAANTEVANVEAAAAAYYAINGNWPGNTNTDLLNGGFLSEPAVYNYTFSSSGCVVVADGEVWPDDSSIIWSAAEHEWHR